MLANPASPTADSARLFAQFRACLKFSRIYCGIVSKTRDDTKALITAEATRDLPAVPEQAGAFAALDSASEERLTESVLPGRAESRRCTSASQQWAVYGAG